MGQGRPRDSHETPKGLVTEADCKTVAGGSSKDGLEAKGAPDSTPTPCEVHHNISTAVAEDRVPSVVRKGPTQASDSERVGADKVPPKMAERKTRNIVLEIMGGTCRVTKALEN